VTLPVLGDLLALARDPIGFLQSLRAQGELVAVHIGPRVIHQVNSPELIRKVLVTEAHDFHRGEIFVQARRTLGDGLATADEPVHMRQRRVVQPAFHHDRLPGYLDVITGVVTAASAAWTPHRVMALDRELAGLSVTITAKTLFRTDLGAAAVREVQRSLVPVINGIARRALLPARIPMPGNRRFEAALGRLRSVVDEVIGAYREDGADHGDLLSMLVAAETSDPEVRTQVLHILMAGTDTMATTLSWAFHELAGHPAVEDRVCAEIAAGLPYLDRVLTETIRLHTPIWLLLRRTTAPVRLGDTTLPAGAEVLVNLPTLHRDPDLFPDPMRFDPDRWRTLPPDLEQRMRFIPFGAGAHKCIGADLAWTTMKATLAIILARWHLAPRPGFRVREVARAFLRPNALPMIPRPR
jgi:cytochrome P450